MIDDIPVYEAIRGIIAGLTYSEGGLERRVAWLTDSHVLGVSKTHEGRIELFLAGAELDPLSRVLRDAIEYQPWWYEASLSVAFYSNRILLPELGHYNEVAAFICVELLRCGVDQDLAAGFRKAEPIVEIAIERLHMSDRSLLGLVGEMLFLRALCRQVSTVEAVQSWSGWQRSLRDFAWGSVGVEVKTTLRASSSHQIHGMHQVGRSIGSSSQSDESFLYLVSIGLQEGADSSESFTVPRLVEAVVTSLRAANRADLVDLFLFRVSCYGSESGFGYDHRSMSGDLYFSRNFVTNFVRTYDMSDENIRILRRDQLVDLNHVDPSSLSFRIDLPTRVRGDLNPKFGLNQSVATVLGSGNF